MRRALLCLVALFLCLSSLFLVCRARRRLWPSFVSESPVAAWMPTSWDGARARASWEAHHAHIHELSPTWYQLDASGDGSINLYAGARDAALVEAAHAHSTLLIPLINDHYPGSIPDPAPVSTMIHAPDRRAAHVATLVDEVVAHSYDGIDIDYESLKGAADRDAFSQFVEELAAALHAQGKLLSVTVHPKTGEPGTWDGPQAQDWTRIGAAADRFRVMTSAYHWAGSDPGPIAPLWWMEDVLRFAVSVVPPHRIYLGLHFYGYDWIRSELSSPGSKDQGPAEGTGSSARSVVWEDVQALIETHAAVPQRRGRDGWMRPVAEPWFTYTDGLGQVHEVWYADGASVEARLELAGKYGLGGVAIWRLGGEDPATWSAIAARSTSTGDDSP
jgi:spore germination protein YaaH